MAFRICHKSTCLVNLKKISTTNILRGGVIGIKRLYARFTFGFCQTELASVGKHIFQKVRLGTIARSSALCQLWYILVLCCHVGYWLQDISMFLKVLRNVTRWSTGCLLVLIICKRLLSSLPTAASAIFACFIPLLREGLSPSDWRPSTSGNTINARNSTI